MPPRPKLENLKSFAKVGDRALSKRVIGTRYPENVDAVLKAMPSDEMQQLIRAAVEKELRDRGLI